MEGTTAKKRTSLWIVLFCMMLYMQVMGIFPGPHVIAEAAETDVTAVSALENLYQGNVYAPPGAKQFFFLVNDGSRSLMKYDLETKAVTKLADLNSSVRFCFAGSWMYECRTAYASSNYALTVSRVSLLTGEREEVFVKQLDSYKTGQIGVDAHNRIYIAYSSDKLVVYDMEGNQIGQSEEDLGIRQFLGFDSVNNNFYFQGNTNWRYWGYDHNMACLKAGRLEEDGSVTCNGKSVTIFYQDYFFVHYGSAEMISGKYLADLTTFSGGNLFILDSHRIEPSEVTDTSTSISIIDSGVSVSSVNLPDATIAVFAASTISSEYDDNDIDVGSIGTRCAYDEGSDTIYVLTDTSTISVYSVAQKQKQAEIDTAHPVYKLLYTGSGLAAIEKDDTGFYVERFDVSYPDSIHLSGKEQMQVGETASCTVTMDTQMKLPYSFTSSDPSVVSISGDGEMAAWKKGTAVITAATDDGKLKAQLTVTVESASPVPVEENVSPFQGSISNNVDDNSYSGYYARRVYSYLVETAPGQLMRVEGGADGSALVEYMDLSGNVGSSRVIEAELPLFGGFYAGTDAYYIVSGQNNPEESDETEILRIVKYDKNWTRLSASSVSGINTYYPFDAGSLRMAETQGRLYIHTCHEMYQSDDGYHHQANMTFVISEADMTLEDSWTDVMNISYGYVSHSFNQFIRTDGNYIYRVDHGDASPRGIAFTKTKVGGSVSSPTGYGTLVGFSGSYGQNYTGTALGGYEFSGTSHLIAYTQDAEYGSSGIRNIHIASLSKAKGTVSVYDVTSYTAEDGVTCGVPQLVKIDDYHFLLMWMETNSNTGKRICKLAQLDSEGKLVTEPYEKKLRLSDCQPILLSDGTIAWYVTDGKRMKLYRIHPYDIPAVAERYVVVFDSNGHGKDPASVVVRPGETVQEPEAPEAELYTFGGWFMESYCQTEYDFGSAVEDDLTLYAKWIHVCAEGHDYDEGVITTEPTCTEKGVKTFTCRRCGYERTSSVRALGHTWEASEVIKEPGCTETGITKYICSVCGAEKEEETPAAGHQYEFVSIEDGLALGRCKVCGKETTGRAPTSFYMFWKKKGDTGYYWSYTPSGLEPGDTVLYWVSDIEYTAEADVTFSEFTFEADRPESCQIDQGREEITFTEEGTYRITIFPTFNPEAKRVYTFNVRKPLTGVTLECDKESPQLYGNSVKLSAAAEGGKGYLTYTFLAGFYDEGAGQSQQDGEQGQPGAGETQPGTGQGQPGTDPTQLGTDPTQPDMDQEGWQVLYTGRNNEYTWTPSSAGKYKIMVKVEDSWDDTTVSSTPVVYEIGPAPVEIEEGGSLQAANTLVYGQAVSNLKTNSVSFVSSVTGAKVEGTFCWDEPDTVYTAGTHNAAWTFLPADESYLKLSGTLEMQVEKAMPVVSTWPEAEEIVYHPEGKLAESSLTGGKADVSGTWQWKDPSQVLTVPGGAYDCRFVPEDTANYETVEAKVQVTVQKAVPVLADLSAGDIVYGNKLKDSALSGRSCYSAEDDTVVPGTFAWADPDIAPAVSDSMNTQYEVVFTPDDTVNYQQVKAAVMLVVEKAAAAPNMPAEKMKVPYSAKSVSATLLQAYSGWVFTEDFTGAELEVEKPLTVIAVYKGEDAGNYIAEQVQIQITRSACDHDGETYTKGAVKPTCTEPGETGDIYCALCDELLGESIELPAAGHKEEILKGYSATYTKEGLTDGKKCSVCGEILEEQKVIPKRIPTSTDGTEVGEGAGQEEAVTAILTSSSEEGPSGTVFYKLALKQKKTTKSSIQISWNRIPGASYIIFGSQCGKKLKELKRTASTSFKETKLKKGKYYKYLVAAVKDGKVVSTSKTVHIATLGGKAGNAKKIEISKKRLKLQVKQTAKLKFKEITQIKGTRIRNHRKTLWESSNPEVATVRKGKVKAVGKGKAVIYVYAQNGVYAKCKVTVR